MILGFTGTRAGPRPAQTAAIRKFLIGMRPKRFVHGAAGGADTIAHRIAQSLRVPEIEIHPSDKSNPVLWRETSGAECIVYPALPPLERNRIIVSRIHGLLICPRSDEEELRSGTWATARYARERGCPIYLILAAGEIVRDRDPVFA